MKDGMYQFIVGVLDLFLWGGNLIGEENLPRRGPAVFIANHLDATGPIATACSIPLRVHPWVIADMMDKDLAPLWLQADFVERQLHFKPPVSRWLSRALCRISVPLFYSLGCIPVYAHDHERMHATLEISMGALREGKFLLVFPEDYRLPKDPVTKMQPFQHSFSRLGERYYAETGERLEFYPVAIHATGHLVVGKPVVFNPFNPVGLERRRLKELMEDTIIAMYMQLEGGNTSVVLTAERK
ncbi:MAG TPA: 1-acyl-sn-glycerol-3-phosphate acyltransferase [Anaerolineales bacterium]